MKRGRKGGAADFKRRKHKAGRTLAPANATDTRFRYQTLILRGQKSLATEGAAAGHKGGFSVGIWLKHISQSRHHNGKAREDAVRWLGAHAKGGIRLSRVGELFGVLVERLNDDEPGVRAAAVAGLVRGLEEAEEGSVLPFSSLLGAQLGSALSGVRPAVRLDGVAGLGVLARLRPLVARALLSRSMLQTLVDGVVRPEGGAGAVQTTAGDVVGVADGVAGKWAAPRSRLSPFQQRVVYLAVLGWVLRGWEVKRREDGGSAWEWLYGERRGEVEDMKTEVARVGRGAVELLEECGENRRWLGIVAEASGVVLRFCEGEGVDRRLVMRLLELGVEDGQTEIGRARSVAVEIATRRGDGDAVFWKGLVERWMEEGGEWAADAVCTLLEGGSNRKVYLEGGGGGGPDRKVYLEGGSELKLQGAAEFVAQVAVEGSLESPEGRLLLERACVIAPETIATSAPRLLHALGPNPDPMAVTSVLTAAHQVVRRSASAGPEYLALLAARRKTGSQPMQFGVSVTWPRSAQQLLVSILIHSFHTCPPSKKLIRGVAAYIAHPAVHSTPASFLHAALVRHANPEDQGPALFAPLLGAVPYTTETNAFQTNPKFDAELANHSILTPDDTKYPTSDFPGFLGAFPPSQTQRISQIVAASAFELPSSSVPPILDLLLSLPKQPPAIFSLFLPTIRSLARRSQHHPELLNRLASFTLPLLLDLLSPDQIPSHSPIPSAPSLLQAIDALATKHNAPLPQIALATLLYTQSDPVHFATKQLPTIAKQDPRALPLLALLLDTQNLKLIWYTDPEARETIRHLIRNHPALNDRQTYLAMHEE